MEVFCPATIASKEFAFLDSPVIFSLCNNVMHSTIHVSDEEKLSDKLE